MRSLLSFALLALPLVFARSHSLRRSCSLHHGSGNSNSSTPPPDPAPGHNPQPSAHVSAAWYAAWHATDFPLESVSWNKYSHMTYAFAILDADGALTLPDAQTAPLESFVSAARAKGVKALVSIGGWTGSIHYSTTVSTDDSRAKFVKTVTDFATKYNLDGIDFDWEYPGTQGIGCNTISPQDTTNFLAFLKLLRADPIGKDLTLTAATSISPWLGEDGVQLTDVSGFADQFDYIAIMNYDIWGSWSASVGPNAPLDDSCASSPTQQQGSAVTAVAKWFAAGMPKDKIVLGIASYGHSFSVVNSDAVSADGTVNLYPAFDAAKQPIGDKWDDSTVGQDVCGNPTGPGGGFDFFGLVDTGFLNDDGTAAAGIDYRFDDCSKTAYVYNEKTQVMVSFDDAKAMTAKGNFVKDQGLRGWAMWEAGGDHKDILLDAIRAGAGDN